MPREQPVEQRRASVAQVQIAGRARRKARDCRGISHAGMLRYGASRLKGSRMTKRIWLLTVGCLALSGQAMAAQPTQWVRVTTSMGDFVIEVNAERAPLTAVNFLKYVKEGFYSGTLF